MIIFVFPGLHNQALVIITSIRADMLSFAPKNSLLSLNSPKHTSSKASLLETKNALEKSVDILMKSAGA